MTFLRPPSFNTSDAFLTKSKHSKEDSPTNSQHHILAQHRIKFIPSFQSYSKWQSVTTHASTYLYMYLHLYTYTHVSSTIDKWSKCLISGGKDYRWTFDYPWIIIYCNSQASAWELQETIEDPYLYTKGGKNITRKSEDNFLLWIQDYFHSFWEASLHYFRVNLTLCEGLLLWRY